MPLSEPTTQVWWLQLKLFILDHGPREEMSELRQRSKKTEETESVMNEEYHLSSVYP